MARFRSPPPIPAIARHCCALLGVPPSFPHTQRVRAHKRRETRQQVVECATDPKVDEQAHCGGVPLACGLFTCANEHLERSVPPLLWCAAHVSHHFSTSFANFNVNCRLSRSCHVGFVCHFIKTRVRASFCACRQAVQTTEVVASDVASHFR
jgi:hypothetical protein